jgi:hypothetical protein
MCVRSHQWHPLDLKVEASNGRILRNTPVQLSSAFGKLEIGQSVLLPPRPSGAQAGGGTLGNDTSTIRQCFLDSTRSRDVPMQAPSANW